MEELRSQKKKTFLQVPESFGGDNKEMASFSFPSSTRREAKAMRASTSSCSVSRAETKSSLELKNTKKKKSEKKRKKKQRLFKRSNNQKSKSIAASIVK